MGNHNYEMAMLGIDAFSKYCVIVPMQSNNEAELALGLYRWRKHIRNSKIVHRYVNENPIPYVATQTHPIYAEIMI